MIIWGMVGNSHDASLAVFKDGKLKWAALAKDFSGVANDPNFSWTMLSVAREMYGEPDKVVWYERPMLKSFRQLLAGQGFLFKENNIESYLKQWSIRCPIEYVQHHHSHAAYGYYTSGFRDASIICIDSIGEWETLTMWKGEGDKLTKVSSQGYPHSLGLWYSAMTQRLGFEPNKDEYKVSQLAMKGDYRFYDQVILNEFFEFEPNNPFCVVKLKENCHRGLRWWRPEIEDLENLAAAVQFVFQKIVLRLTTSMALHMPSKNLIVTGGCALNKGAMDYIRPNWENLWIPPNPGDPGSCIGAVLASEKKHIDFNPEVWYNNK
jgi:carbamoyltransferase